MKALVKRYPDNARTEAEAEVYLQDGWHDWIGENGEPLTDENYGYALCEDVPEGVEVTPDDFEITEYVEEVEDENGDKVERKHWTAKYVGGGE